MMKYVPNDTISVRDAIIGPDINAGSMPIFLPPSEAARRSTWQ